METLTVDLTYGQALYDAASDRGKVDEIGTEYKAVSEIFDTNPALKKLFLIPTVTAAEKKAAARKIFGGRISQELVNFICILIDKRRISAWNSIGRQYEKLIWDRDGLTKGILYTALPIDAARLKAFEQKTGAALGKEVKLENRIDATLIGGARIYVDGKLIDASVKTRLENMKQRIKL
jgi:ATP synthase F1 delta subunit